VEGLEGVVRKEKRIGDTFGGAKLAPEVRRKEVREEKCQV
jgi:hypothetical protein